MKPTLWSPWLSTESDIRSALERFERLFSDATPHRRPAVDVFETDGKLVVEMELPGVDIERDVEIKVEEDMLDISGETHSDRDYTEEGAHITERSFGSFQRRILLPDGVDPDAIEASYTAGILNVTVPLPEAKAVTAKTIPVRATEK